MIGLTERIQRLRQDTLDIARDSLDHDIRAYRVLSHVAVRLTDIIQQNGTSESPVSADGLVPKSPDAAVTALNERISSSTIPIYARYRGVTHHAKLDPSRISSTGRGDCVLFEGQWMSVSGSVREITSTSVNGWVQFWRYRRDNGVEAQIDEIRKRQLRSD